MDNLREIIFVQVRTLNNFELRHCTMKLRQNSELKLQWELDKLFRTEGSLCHLNGGRESLEHEDLSCFAKLHPIESFDGRAMGSEWLTSGISGTQLLDGSGCVAAHWQRHKWLHTWGSNTVSAFGGLQLICSNEFHRNHSKLKSNGLNSLK